MRLTVVGSINLDFVATASRLPRAGETVTGATLARHPGGKGANQALAAQRLGTGVCMIGRVGRDGMAGEAMALLLADDVDVAGVATDASAPTGVALIAVDPEGENHWDKWLETPVAQAAIRQEMEEAGVVPDAYLDAL
jgi:ribokinase